MPFSCMRPEPARPNFSKVRPGRLIGDAAAVMPAVAVHLDLALAHAHMLDQVGVAADADAVAVAALIFGVAGHRDRNRVAAVPGDGAGAVMAGQVEAAGRAVAEHVPVDMGVVMAADGGGGAERDRGNGDAGECDDAKTGHGNLLRWIGWRCRKAEMQAGVADQGARDPVGHQHHERAAADAAGQKADGDEELQACCCPPPGASRPGSG